MMILNKITICIVFFSLVFPANAFNKIQQNQLYNKNSGILDSYSQDKNIPVYKQKIEDELSHYLIQYAKLTPAESKLFLPLFFAMKDKIRSIERKKNKILRSTNANDIKEKDCIRALEVIANLDKKQLRITIEYQERFVKLIGAQKVTKVLLAEKRFGRQAFRQIMKSKRIKARHSQD